MAAAFGATHIQHQAVAGTVTEPEADTDAAATARVVAVLLAAILASEQLDLVVGCQCNILRSFWTVKAGLILRCLLQEPGKQA